MKQGLSCSLEDLGGVTILHLAGELTAAEVIHLAEIFHDARNRNARRVVVAVQGLRVMDSSGFVFLRANISHFAGYGIKLEIGGLTQSVAAGLGLLEKDRTILNQWMRPLEKVVAEDAREGPTHPMPAQEAQTVAETPPVWIMVVDDEEMVLNTIALYLKHKGFEVLTARNIHEAVSSILPQRDRVRLVLVDDTLGTESGLDAVTNLVKIKPDLKVILTSGLGSEALENLHHPNIVGRLQKPFFGEQLVNIIQQALATP